MLPSHLHMRWPSGRSFLGYIVVVIVSVDFPQLCLMSLVTPRNSTLFFSCPSFWDEMFLWRPGWPGTWEVNELTSQLWQSSCIFLPNAGIMSLHHHIWLVFSDEREWVWKKRFAVWLLSLSHPNKVDFLHSTPEPGCDSVIFLVIFFFLM